MTPCRLNNLFLLYVHTSKTDELDLVTIARTFVSVNSLVTMVKYNCVTIVQQCRVHFS